MPALPLCIDHSLGTRPTHPGSNQEHRGELHSAPCIHCSHQTLLCSFQLTCASLACTQGIRLPGETQSPQGRSAPVATGAGQLWRDFLLSSKGTKGGGVKGLAVGATWMPALRDRLEPAYHIPSSSATQLPNIIDMGEFSAKEEHESATPMVLFLGRCDPYKRPWLLVPLARKFPHVNFVVAGQSHFAGRGSYRLPRLPNLEMVGHIHAKKKRELLKKAWLLINLSVHEGVAISMLEALFCATPIVSLVDPGGLVSSYGLFAGPAPGDGQAALPKLEESISMLLSNRSLRYDLGKQGRAHVMATHNEQQFVQGFVTLLDQFKQSGSEYAPRLS